MCLPMYLHIHISIHVYIPYEGCASYAADHVPKRHTNASPSHTSQEPTGSVLVFLPEWNAVAVLQALLEEASKELKVKHQWW
jgi:hypothetical protein